MSYRDDLPGGGGYAEQRAARTAEREHWRRHSLDIQAAWMGAVVARLRKGPAITAELAEAAGIKPGTEYGRFLTMLELRRRTGFLAKTGKRRGAIHMNNIWELAK